MVKKIKPYHWVKIPVTHSIERSIAKEKKYLLVHKLPHTNTKSDMGNCNIKPVDINTDLSQSPGRVEWKWLFGLWENTKDKEVIWWNLLDNNNEDNDYEDDNKLKDKWTPLSVSTIPPSKIFSISIHLFTFYHTSQCIGKSVILFVPQNSEVGGDGIIINVLQLLGERLRNTK